MARSKQHDGQPGDLGLRLLSAAVLIPFALFVVWKGGIWLAFASGVFSSLMAYEWVRMTASPSMKSFVTLAILPFVPLILGAPVWALWVFALCAILATFTHPLREKRGSEAFGYLYITGMPLALYFLRDGPWDGAAAALILMGIVWGSDSAAYFTGRSIRGPLLHPDSPSKTWSGAIGGAGFSALCGLLAAYITGGNYIAWFAMGALISIFAQFGDLFESSTKRRHGVKDSSAMVPGHGGLLDRVDGLGFVCVAAVLVFSFAPPLLKVLGLNL